MNTDIKQAMHVEAGKSFGTAEANENERRWNDDKIDRKNQDPTNHYDRTRMKLNFEIGPDGKIHPLGYQEKSLEVRLQERLDELGWKPFKADSKIQPNCCAKFVFGGNHDRTLEMAFGNQSVNLEKGADNSHLHRCEEIENWAKDVYDWCSNRYGQKNIVGFQVHIDESSPHIHALIVPVGIRPKSGRESVMWSAKFGKDRYEYGRILKEMHTSLYDEVGSKYGLERGDSIDGRNVQHLNKRDYIRKLTKEAKQAEKAVKGLQSMMRNLESRIFSYRLQLEEADKELASGKITLDRYEAQKADIQELIAEYQTKLEDKTDKLHVKEQELERLTGKCQDSYERLTKACELAHAANVHIILKGAYSAIITPAGKCYFNPTGNPGMATGGSGDVLTGVILALLAQGYPAEDAAKIGTYIHGLAGDFAQKKQGMIGLIASDIITCLPTAWRLVSE